MMVDVRCMMHDGVSWVTDYVFPRCMVYLMMMMTMTMMMCAWTFCPSVDSSDHGPYTLDERAHCINCLFQVYVKFIIAMTLCKLSMQTVEFSRGMDTRPCTRYRCVSCVLVGLTSNSHVFFNTFMR